MNPQPRTCHGAPQAAPLLYGSVCSGIEAVSLAWQPLGLEAAWFAEIEPFPSALLAHRYPRVPNLGDMTAIARQVRAGMVPAPDILVGGTPCQSFSVAGIRGGLSDPRGALTLAFVELAHAIDQTRHQDGRPPVIIVWENVPGILSTRDNAFGCFLAGLAGEDAPLQPPGDRWAHAGAVYGPARAVAWRTLDAQYLGVAQRRRRVFVVASARSGFDPAQVLFEWDGVRRDTAPSREARQTAPTIPARRTGGGGLGTDFDCDGGLIQAYGIRTANTSSNGWGIQAEHTHTLDQAMGIAVAAYGGNRTSGAIEVSPALLAQPGSGYKNDFESETFLLQPTHSLRGEGFDASEDGTGRGTPLVPVHREIAPTVTSNYGKQPDSSDTSSGPMPVPIAFDTTQITSAANGSKPQPGGPCHPLAAGAHPPAVAFNWEGGGTQTSIGYVPSASITGSLSVGQTPAVAVQASQSGVRISATIGTLDANYGSRRHNGVMLGMQVRRLTPVECERLQGFPDGYTAIPWRGKPANQCPDGPRYKAIGNSMAVPCMAWLGHRLLQHLDKGKPIASD
ncbi:MAG: hypothetical protein A2710_23850 [Burkholderiales bacterium RIFCSPHIGHO2_01_FULL_64_960]|nr:MAG: hypothetical protein A2710_23850 [Burkholderiales bacterium RIFCSPHIGHO2_01_FULL_64_960]